MPREQTDEIRPILSVVNKAKIALALGLGSDVFLTLFGVSLNSFEALYAKDPMAALSLFANILQLISDVGAVKTLYSMGKTHGNVLTGTPTEAGSVTIFIMISMATRAIALSMDLYGPQGTGNAAVNALTTCASIFGFFVGCVSGNKLGEVQANEVQENTDEENQRLLNNRV